MNRFHQSALCFSAALLLAAGGYVRADEGDDQPGKQRTGLIARALHLLPPAYAAELDLTPEQQQSVKALEAEFRKKRQELLMQSVMKVWSIIDSLDDEGEKREPAPVLAIAHEVTGGLLNMRRSRAGYEHKLVAVLNVEQREQFALLKERGPRERRADGHAAVLVQPWPQGAERRLNLTPEQQRKLTELRQEWRKQFDTVLTPEQRQQLERFTSPPRRSRDGAQPSIREND